MRLMEVPPSGKAPALIDIPSILTRESLDTLMQELQLVEENLSVGSVVLVFPDFADGVPPLDQQKLFPEFDALLGGVKQEGASDWARRVKYLRNVYVPVIAAVDGSCSGWALELALASDFIVCGSGAEIAVTECPATMSEQLAMSCGAQRMKRLLMLGERLDGPKAVDWGIVNYAVESSCQDFALELAERLALPARDAMSVLKESLNAVDENRFIVPGELG